MGGCHPVVSRAESLVNTDEGDERGEGLDVFVVKVHFNFLCYSET